MIEGVSLNFIIFLLAAVFLFWNTSLKILATGRIVPFLPLIVLFAALAGVAAVDFYQLYNNDLAMIFNVLFLLFYAWFVIVLVQLLNRNL